MDPVNLPTSWTPGLDIASAGHAAHASAVPPVAPPELVHKFEAMMARVQVPGTSGAGGWHVPQAVVDGVDHRVKARAEALEQMLSIDPSHMSLADMQVFQVRSMVQLGMLSMTQTACLQVLGSAKSSVSDLMKNQ